MFEKKIPYRDFNGDKHVEVAYFHLFGPDITELGFDPTFNKRGFLICVREILRSGGTGKVFALYKLLIVSSYGRRSTNGDRIIKSLEFTQDFLTSQPYEEFCHWLIDDTKNAEEFWNGIAPEHTINKGFGTRNRQLLDMSTDELDRLIQKKLLRLS